MRKLLDEPSKMATELAPGVSPGFRNHENSLAREGATDLPAILPPLRGWLNMTPIMSY